MAVDCGLMFPDDELPGIDYVIPDFTYFAGHGERVPRGRAHPRPRGPHRRPCLSLRAAHVPVYGTPLTLALAPRRLREHGRAGARGPAADRPRDAIQGGPFVVEPIRVTHPSWTASAWRSRRRSAPSSTPAISSSTPARWTASARRAPLRRARRARRALLCSDSTNVDRPGHTARRLKWARPWQGASREAPGRILVATFASHIHRIQQVLTLAAAGGRNVALARPHAWSPTWPWPRSSGYLSVPDGLLLLARGSGGAAGERQVILVHRQPGRDALRPVPHRRAASTSTCRWGRAISSSSRRASSPATSARSGA